MSEAASASSALGGSIGPLRGLIRRQTHRIPDRWKTVFDWAFGVVLPVSCIVLDPIVFNGWGNGGGLLAWARPLAYTAILPQIAAMAWWLTRRRGPYLLAAYLRVGGVVALLLGVLLLPLSFVGLFIHGIGLAGLTPFATGYAFHRNARLAAEAGREERDGAQRVRAFAIAVVLALGIPVTLQVATDRAMDAAIRTVATARGEPAQIATRVLALLWFAESDERIIAAYRAESRQDRREAIGRAFHRITGERIDGSASAD